MTWTFERRVEHEELDKGVRVRGRVIWKKAKRTTIERVWTSSERRYAIFHYPPNKTYSAQCDDAGYFVLGERIKSLARAKALCEADFLSADWDAREKEYKEFIRNVSVGGIGRNR